MNKTSLRFVIVAIAMASAGLTFAAPVSAVPQGSCTTGTYTESVVGNDTVGVFEAPVGANTSGCTWTVPNGVESVRVLVVAGGGGGGGNLTSGGGGGGGVIHSVGASVTPGNSVSVVVGKGGAGGTNAWNQPNNYNNGFNGSDSSFGVLTAVGGGGGGGGGTNSQLGNPGSAGGSGGGGGRCWVGCNTSFSSSNGNRRLGGASTTGQGNAGGNAPFMSGGGGGGAGASGSASTGAAAGNGGDGVEVDISGTSSYFGGGGGGGSENTSSRALGGLGGGGRGGATGSIDGSNGQANTGGGGGGTRDGIAGVGGSGIVILRWGSAPSAPNIALSSSSGFGIINSSVGSLYSISNTGGAVSEYSISPSLPAGLSFNTSTGLISGTPTALSSTISYVITARRVSSSNGASSTSSESFSFGVFSVAPTTTTTTTTTSTTTTTTTTTVPNVTATTAPQGQSSVATIPQSSEVTTTTISPMSQVRSVAVPSTSSSSTSSTTSTTTTTVPAPEAPTADPGAGILVIDGRETVATVTRTNNRVTVGAGGVSVTFNGIADDGNVVPLDSDGNLRVTGGDSVSVEGLGFAANQDVEVWMFSTPQLLATVKADANGKVVDTIKLPMLLEEGNHRFVVDGTSAAGADALVALGVIVGYESSGLSTTGKLLIALPIGLAIIIGLVIPTTLRRRKKTAHV